jgi:hypothetical protein
MNALQLVNEDDECFPHHLDVPPVIRLESLELSFHQ